MVFEAIKQKTLPKDSIKRGLQLKFWGVSIPILGNVKYWSRRKTWRRKKITKIVPTEKRKCQEEGCLPFMVEADCWRQKPNSSEQTEDKEVGPQRMEIALSKTGSEGKGQSTMV